MAYNVSSREHHQTMGNYGTVVSVLFIFFQNQPNLIYLLRNGLISAKRFTFMYVLWVASAVREGFCVGRNTLAEEARQLPT